MTVAFPMRGDARRVQRANVTPAGGASPTVHISILECYCACRRHQRCHLKERRLRYVPALYGQLSDKLLLALYLHRTPYVKRNRMVSV